MITKSMTTLQAAVNTLMRLLSCFRSRFFVVVESDLSLERDFVALEITRVEWFLFTEGKIDNRVGLSRNRVSL